MWMCLGCIYSKRCRSDRKRQMPHDFTYVWNLKIKQKENMITTESLEMNGCTSAIPREWAAGWQLLFLYVCNQIFVY